MIAAVSLHGKVGIAGLDGRMERYRLRLPGTFSLV